jgi:NTE family protein
MTPTLRIAKPLAALLVCLLTACASTPPKVETPPPTPVEPPPKPKPVVALALGGGAAKGFAHIGVIKALEAQGISPDIVIGTSAGSVVGAMYAAGKNGFQLQELAFELDESKLTDWVIFEPGFLKGEKLANFINKAVGGKTLEKLPRKFGVVATDLASGEPVVFRTGDTGTAVRASASVPGVFQAVNILGRDYVDGGLVAPVPVRFARDMGATFVIAVDISDKPVNGKTKGTLDILLQTVSIMGHTINRHELPKADVVIQPDISKLGSVDFKTRHLAVLEGEKAAAAKMAEIKAKLDAFTK